jgi:hypothetical protein
LEGTVLPESSSVSYQHDRSAHPRHALGHEPGSAWKDCVRVTIRRRVIIKDPCRMSRPQEAAKRMRIVVTGGSGKGALAAGDTVMRT